MTGSKPTQGALTSALLPFLDEILRSPSPKRLAGYHYP